MLEKIKKFVKKADIFGVKPELYIHRKELFRSLNGGILTVLLISGFFVIGILYLLEYIYGKRVTMFERETYNDSSGKIELGGSNFMFAFGFSNVTLNQIYLSKKFVDIKIFHRQNLRNVNDSKIYKKEVEIPLAACNPSFFPNHQEDFERLAIDQYLCPVVPNGLFLEGSFVSDLFSFIKIVVEKCAGEHCASENETKTILQENKNLEMEMFVTTIEFSLKSNEPLLKYKIVSEIHFSIDSTGFAKRSSDIFIMESMLTSQSDAGTDVSHGFSYRSESKEDINFSVGDDRPLAAFYLRKSLYTTLTERNFWRIGDLASYLGGLWNPIFFICLLLGRRFNQKACLVELANNLYNFVSSEKKQGEPNTENKQEPTVVKPGADNKTDKNLKTFLSQKSQINDSTWTIYRREIFPCLRRSRDDMLMKKAFNMLKIDLDLFSIIKSLQQFQKLKEILFDSNQIRLFDFIPKTNIYDHIDVKNSSHIYKSIQLTKQKKVMKRFFNKKMGNLDESQRKAQKRKEKEKKLKRYKMRIFKGNSDMYSDFKHYLKLLKKYKFLKQQVVETNEDNKKMHDNVPFFLTLKLISVFDEEIGQLRKNLNLTEAELDEWLKEASTPDNQISPRNEAMSAKSIPTERIEVPPHL